MKKMQKMTKKHKKMLTYLKEFVILLMHLQKRPLKAKKSVKKTKKVVDKVSQ